VANNCGHLANFGGARLGDECAKASGGPPKCATCVGSRGDTVA